MHLAKAPVGPLQVCARERSEGRPIRRRLSAPHRRRARLQAELARRGPLPLGTDDGDCGSQRAGLSAGGAAGTGGSHAAVFARALQQVAPNSLLWGEEGELRQVAIRSEKI
jgi:hypothetical protein